MSRDREIFVDEIGKKIKREISTVVTGPADAYNSDQMGRRHVALSPPGIFNTITPCAACKLLRRRCAEECPFSPYFSPHEPHKFAAVHKVFGASNVSKMLMEVPECQRADAANSLVYEANLRLRDPVYGCMGAICALQQQIQALQAELNAVRNEILKYKYGSDHQATNTNMIINPNSTHHAALINPNSVAAISQNNTLPNLNPPRCSPPPPPPLPPPPSIVISSSSSTTTASSMYNQQPSSSGGYSSISSDQNNVPYFD
ncbi:LOB domain-containing protein 15 [Carica papaya]|uniref:LOB domain-containing protein 15 n=1 Tax=Carica papaya TaxID=3649 RepID=UPI000B8C70D2|nr:LOB domain-containing protein 15 [Carica papaya]